MHFFKRLLKQARVPDKSYAMEGELYLSSTGWLMLRVPHPMVHGVFSTINETGLELPKNPEGKLEAHITVMRPEELQQLGGAEKVDERGKRFSYTLGPLRTVARPADNSLSRVWYIEVKSPELSELRRSYGLSNTPDNDKYQFHITVAVRRKNVLSSRDTSKADNSSTTFDGVLEGSSDFSGTVSMNKTSSETTYGKSNLKSVSPQDSISNALRKVIVPADAPDGRKIPLMVVRRSMTISVLTPEPQLRKLAAEKRANPMLNPYTGSAAAAGGDGGVLAMGSMAMGLLQPVFQSWAKSMGIVPGDFKPGRNFVDMLRDQDFQVKLQRVMGTATETDSGRLANLMKGIYTMTGGSVTPEVDAHIQSLSSMGSKIMPYFQAFMPEAYDMLHGSRGSTATLTSAIAQTNKAFETDPAKAHDHAQEVMKYLYGDEKLGIPEDPMRHRGYSSRQFGQMYSMAIQLGEITPNMTPAQTAAALSNLAGPLSAARDSSSAAGVELSMNDQMMMLAQVKQNNPYIDGSTLEKEMRIGSWLQGQGGAYQAAWARGGQQLNQGEYSGAGSSMPQMASRYNQSMNRAANSRAGNQLGAAMRLAENMQFSPSSEAGQWLERARTEGAQGFHNDGDFIAMLTRSGVSVDEAQDAWSDRKFNKQQLTPELVRGIQRHQYSRDLMPQMDRAWNNYVDYRESKGQTASRSDMGWVKRKNRIAQRYGYNNAQDLEQQWASVNSGNMQNVYSDADEAATQRQEHAHHNRGNFWERLVDRTYDAVNDPNTGLDDLAVAATTGGVPQEQVSPSVQEKYPEQMPTPPASGI